MSTELSVTPVITEQMKSKLLKEAKFVVLAKDSTVGKKGNVKYHTKSFYREFFNPWNRYVNKEKPKVNDNKTFNWVFALKARVCGTPRLVKLYLRCRGLVDEEGDLVTVDSFLDPSMADRLQQEHARYKTHTLHTVKILLPKDIAVLARKVKAKEFTVEPSSSSKRSKRATSISDAADSGGEEPTTISAPARGRSVSASGRGSSPAPAGKRKAPAAKRPEPKGTRQRKLQGKKPLRPTSNALQMPLRKIPIETWQSRPRPTKTYETTKCLSTPSSFTTICPNAW